MPLDQLEKMYQAKVQRQRKEAIDLDKELKVQLNIKRQQQSIAGVPQENMTSVAINTEPTHLEAGHEEAFETP